MGFAVFAAGLVALSASVVHKRQALWLWPLFTGIIWLHPVMDFLTGGGAPLVLLWPLWSGGFGPVEGGLPCHPYTTSWSKLPSLLFDWAAFRDMFYEALVFGPLLAASVLSRIRTRVLFATSGLAVWVALLVMAHTRPDGRLSIQGQVLDPSGQPVAKVEIRLPEVFAHTFINEKGSFHSYEIEETDGFATPCTSDERGIFNGRIAYSYRPAVLLAKDRERRIGGLCVLNDKSESTLLTINLVGLVRVRGTIAERGTANTIHGVFVFSSLAPDQAILNCPPESGNFFFEVPPGDYVIQPVIRSEAEIKKSVHIPPGITDLDLGLINP